MFSAAEATLHQVFNENRYIVPYYQRPYSWTTENAEELWNDIFEAWSEDSDKDSGYFLGSVVLIEKKEGREEIVDGQQRFLTLQLLIKSLAERISDEGTRTNLSKYFISAEDAFSGTKSELVVEPSRRYLSCFTNIMKGIALSEHDLKLASNFISNLDLFRCKAANLSEEKVISFGKFALQKVHLALLKADSESRALRIFSVLNDRGLDLHPVDILKAKLLEQSDLNDKQKMNISDNWEKFEEDLGRKSFQDLFSHLRMIAVKSKSKKPLQDDILKRYAPTPNSASNFLQIELPAYVSAYMDLKSSELVAVRNLNAIGIRSGFKDWEAPAIFLLRHKTEFNNSDSIVKGISLATSFAAATEMTDGKRAGRFGEILRHLEQSRKNNDIIRDRNTFSLTKDELDKLIDSMSTNMYKPRGHKSLFLWLETIIGDGERTVDAGEITIEHLLPRTMGTEPYWTKRFTQPEWSEMTNSIGNLVIVSGRSNRRMARKSFRDKIEIIESKGGSQWAITNMVLSQTDWTPTTIKQRTDQLIRRTKSVVKVCEQRE